MHQIDSLTGSQLMRLWGVESWPQVVGSYYLWNGVGVFVVIERGAHVELHMAMKNGERHKCRDAVADVLSLIGDREVWAQISTTRKHVCNLAKKFGFVEVWRGCATLFDGSKDETILMKRFQHG
ncbi:hypothetical protein GAW91_000134 [Vibrio fluvialis]|nr:hypothetical protein [Vibrio fluvialis]